VLITDAAFNQEALTRVANAGFSEQEEPEFQQGRRRRPLG
jgi:hypothetical protein